MEKKNLIILVVCLIVSVLSVSLAYYSARIIGDGKNISVNAKELTINFDNNNEIASGIIEPGWSSTNTFNVENKSKASFTYDIVLKNYKNTTKTNGYLVYKITSTNGYNMSEYKDMPKDGDNTYDLVIARGITIEPGSSNKQSYSLEIKYLDSDEDQSIDMGSTVTGSLYIVESKTNENNPYTEGTLGYQIMEDNSNIKTRTDFSTTYTDVNIGTMFKAQEDNTDVYYFAGDARNNWVKFGGYYWRIVRTNSDGSIRLLYHGTSPDTQEAYIGTSAFNSVHNNSMYISYMYGTSGSLESNRTNTNNSTIKTAIDNWYSKNMTSYTKYLSTTAIYCNDRSVIDGSYSATGSLFDYAARTRLVTNKTPTYDCTVTEDKFTVDSSTGNGKLTYPIALMTADEISFAGGGYKTDATTWYYYNSTNTSSTGSTYWWLLSPGGWNGTSAYSFNARGIDVPGRLYNSTVDFILGVRPIVSLKADVLYKSGNGSASNPYEIQETPDTLSDKIIAKSLTNTDGVYNENGYRYEGSNPNNYIYMVNNGTNELWRIIGLFADGTSGGNVIRVRRYYAQNSYPTAAFDSNGSNVFANSTMKNTTLASYTTSNYKNTVNFKIYIGGMSDSDVTAASLYSSERASSITGAVALMYPSDYAYGVLSSVCARTITPYLYDRTAACYNSNWLFQGSSKIQWLISPFSSSTYSSYAFFVRTSGSVGDSIAFWYGSVTDASAFSPVMALSADVKVTGSGTESDPYVMQ